jgi:hypothetical protein
MIQPSKIVKPVTLLSWIILSNLVVTRECRTQDCTHGIKVINEDFYFRASSDHGAASDVVAIEVSIKVNEIHGGPSFFGMVVSYDDLVAELVGGPEYSEQFSEFLVFGQFTPVPDGYLRPGATGKAFILTAVFIHGAADEYLASGNSLPLATFYFKLKGTAGNSTLLRFNDSDFVLPGDACLVNSVTFHLRPDEHRPSDNSWIEVLSKIHVPGEIRILPGEATHPDPPDSPPLAKVYPDQPGPGEAHVQFELTGGAVRPGATEVPVDLYITSNYEFASYAAAGVYSNQHLILRRIEDHTRPGGQRIVQETGEFSFISDLSRWRIGHEDERVRVATLYFDVSPLAEDGESLALELKTNGSPSQRYVNWIGILSEKASQTVPISTEIEPLVVTQGVLKVRSASTTSLGDANFDRAFDISDPISVVEFLFQGGLPPACFNAADFSSDGHIDISDPIAMLGELFLMGSGSAAPTEVSCE